MPSSAADLNLSPQRKREKLFEALLNQLEAEARRPPVLMVFEDAHWIDPTSRELLDLSVDRVRHLPVLLAITFRPEFQPPWGGRSYVTNMALNRLGERDGEALVHKLAGNAALTAEIVAEIVERTDGVPLFVEELTKAVLESAAQSDRVAAVLGAASLAAHSVPATLHASLMARLDRLGPAAKETAQIGAVLGREFSYELIEPVAQRPERELQAALGSARAMPDCCSAAASLRMPPICSSTRWCRTPPTAPCCAGDGRNCMGASRRHWKRISPISSSASPNCSPII